MRSRACSVDGCSRPVRGKGLCNGHLARLKRTGTVEPNPEKFELERLRCRYENCDRSAKTHGFCKGHYAMVRYSPDREHLLPPDARAPRCLAPECADPQYSSGLCHKHSEICRRKGAAWVADLDIVLPKPPTLGSRITLERIRQGLTLEELAERVGVARERIRQVELSDTLAASRIKTYADALGVSVDYLIDGVSLEEIQRLPKNKSLKRYTLEKRIEALEASLKE